MPPAVLRDRDLPPFAAVVDAGVRAVMTAHIRVPALTGDGPATFSRAVLHDLLRVEYGFTGAVITDALEMKGAVLAAGGVGAGAVRALAAGADLLCLGARVDAEPARTAVTPRSSAVAIASVSRSYTTSMWSETKPIGDRTTAWTPRPDSSCSRSLTSGSSQGWLGGPDREQYARSHSTGRPRRSATAAATVAATSRCCAAYDGPASPEASSMVDGMEWVTKTSRAPCGTVPNASVTASTLASTKPGWLKYARSLSSTTGCSPSGRPSSAPRPSSAAQKSSRY